MMSLLTSLLRDNDRIKRKNIKRPLGSLGPQAGLYVASARMLVLQPMLGLCRGVMP